MNTLDIFFIIVALNCGLFFALCIYATFLNKKQVKIKTNTFNPTKIKIREPLHYNCRAFYDNVKPEGADYMKITISDHASRKCNLKDEV